MIKINYNPFPNINLSPILPSHHFMDNFFKRLHPQNNHILSNFRESSTSQPYSKGDTNYGYLF